MNYFTGIFIAYIICVSCIHYFDDKPWPYAFFAGSISMFFSLLIVTAFISIFGKKDKK